jgi:hypothetical protein
MGSARKRDGRVDSRHWRILPEFFPAKSCEADFFPVFCPCVVSSRTNQTNFLTPANRLIRMIALSRDRQTKICGSRNEA